MYKQEQVLKLAEELVSLSPTGSLAQYKAKDLLAAIQPAEQPEDERARFEAWNELCWEKEGGAPKNMHRKDDDGDYEGIYTQLRWETWQAAKRDAHATAPLTRTRELTDAEIERIWQQTDIGSGAYLRFARALLSASKGKK